MRRLAWLCLLFSSLALGQGYQPPASGGGGSGVTSLGNVAGPSNAKAGAISGSTYTAAPVSASFPGMMLAADKAKLDAITGTCTGTNTGDWFLTLAAVGGTPNANGGTISGAIYTPAYASATYPGMLSASDKAKLNAFTGTATGTNTGDWILTLGPVGGTPNANGGVISGTVYTQAQASSSFPGAMPAADKAKLDAITGTHTGTNTGDDAVGTYSTTSSPNVITLSSHSLVVHEADATNPGTVKAAWADILAKLTPIRHPRTVAYQPGGANSSTGVAGQVYLEQIELGPVRGKMSRIGFLVGATPGGNFTVGLYGPVDTSGSPPYTCQGAPLISQSSSTSGSTGATNNIQYATISSPPYHGNGLHCLAIETDGTAVTFYRQTQTRASKNAWQAFTQTYGALPSTVPTLTLTDEANNFPLLDEDVIP
jgi:hypothetical protein